MVRFDKSRWVLTDETKSNKEERYSRVILNKEERYSRMLNKEERYSQVSRLSDTRYSETKL